MTRSFVIIIGIIIALSLSWHFYIQWEMKQFKASLPKPFANRDTAKAEKVSENPEKSDTVTSGEHRHGDVWHATPHPSELPSDKTQEKPLPEEHAQLGVPNVEAPEPIEDPGTAQLHAEKLEMAQLQEKVDDMANGFYNAIEAQSISVDEANAIFEEINDTLQHLRERRHQWLRKYAEHHGTEYQGPEHWVNPEMIDEAALREQSEQVAQGHAVSRGYILLPRSNR